MRLFIAISFEEHMIRALEDLQQQLMRQGVRGRFTPVENLHLTLAFIGDYPDPEPVLDILDSVSMKPFELTLDGFGNFGDLWWVGLKKTEAMTACVKRLRHSLADAGIPFDRKKFSPHITLVRRASYVLRPEIRIPDVSMTAAHASLFRSDRGRNGMIYTEIG